jgi:hypothetical protein
MIIILTNIINIVYFVTFYNLIIFADMNKRYNIN